VGRGVSSVSLLGLAIALLLGVVGVRADDAVRIDAPANGTRVSGRVEILGRASTADPGRFRLYRLHYGSGPSASVLRPIGPAVEQPVEDGPLGIWDTSTLMPGEYLLLLTVYDTSNATTTASVVVSVAPMPTPTRVINQQPLVYPTPGEVPTPGPEDQSQPELPPPLPELDPQVRQVDVPPPAPPPPPGLPNLPPPPPPPPAIVPIAPSQDRPPNQLPPAPGPSFSDPPPIPTPLGPGSAPGLAPINLPPPPPPPVIQPYEPPPPLPTTALPTPFGIPE
jgi:hypothetical protein